MIDPEVKRKLQALYNASLEHNRIMQTQMQMIQDLHSRVKRLEAAAHTHHMQTNGVETLQ